MKKRMSGVENIANLSGDSLASVFGEISPKIRTRAVTTTVATVVPVTSLHKILMKNTVAIAVRAMLTALFPTRIVDRSLSYFSDSASVLPARLLPFSASALSLALLSEENAVSVAEKYEDIRMSSAITIMVITSFVSISVYDSLLFVQ